MAVTGAGSSGGLGSTARSGPSSGDDDALLFGRALLVEVREELARADTKASILLAVVAIVLGFAASNPPTAAPAPGVVLATLWLWTWWAGLALTLCGTGLLISAVYPRTGHARTPAGRVYFFGDAKPFTDREALREAVEATSRGELDRVVDQLFVLSASVARKDRLIQLAIPASGAGTVLIVLALGLGRLP